MDRLNKILPYLERNEVAFFIGAGLSKIAGCYDWNSIVKEMLDHPVIKERGVNKDDLFGKERNEELIDYCKEQFSNENAENTFWGIARKAITFNPGLFDRNYLPLIKILKQINPPPKLVLTTNIDDCLESTGEYDLSEIYFKPKEFTTSKLNGSGIFHIHGYKEKFQESLLTRTSYIEHYAKNNFQEFIKEFFSKYSVLFLGYSLRDQEIKDILAETKDSRKKHFLLLPEEDEFPESKSIFYNDRYGIVTIKYGKRESFTNILSEWVTRNFAATSLEEPEGYI